MIHRLFTVASALSLLLCSCQGCCINREVVGMALNMDFLMLRAGNLVYDEKGCWPSSKTEIEEAAARLGHPVDPKAFRITLNLQLNGDMVVMWTHIDGLCLTGGEARLSLSNRLKGGTTRPTPVTRPSISTSCSLGS
jgi:hypothetical protein